MLRRRSAAMAKPKAVRQRAITRMCTSRELQLLVSPISRSLSRLPALEPGCGESESGNEGAAAAADAWGWGKKAKCE